MRSADFNETAMETKIEKNLAVGFTLDGILIELQNELLRIYKTMLPLEQRAIELSDQVDYVKEKMAKDEGKNHHENNP